LDETSGEVAARTATTRIDRTQQMKISVVNNHEGPRAQQKPESSLPSGIEERVRNIETYLEMAPTGNPFNERFSKRLK
jgi:hypothetical protein